MKHLSILLFGFFSFILFSACDEDEKIQKEQTPDAEEPNEDEGNDTNETASKILIVYFSRTGNNYPNQWLEVGHTARVAGYIAELTAGERFEIIPTVAYPDDYQQMVAIARTEYDNNARPSIQTTIKNIADYDTIFIGTPIWHGSVPMIIRTFYEAYNLTGKTIIPFTTHAGSGLVNCMSVAREYYPQGRILDGLAVQGTSSANAKGVVETWLRSINVIE